MIGLEEDPAVKEKARARFVEDAAHYGIERSDAHLVFDLVIKAKTDAFDAIGSVSKTAPPHMQSLVLASTLHAIYTTLQSTEEELTLLAASSTLRYKSGK